MGSLFAGGGAKEALTPRKEGETGLEEFERRAGGAGQAMLGGAPIVHGAAEAAPSAGDVGLAARTETGKLKPGIRAASRLAGAFAGHMTGIPYMGELGGYLLGPSIADMVIPNRPFDIPTKGEGPGGPLPLPEEAYQQRAEDLTRRGKEQEALDRAAARPVKIAPMSPVTLPPELRGTSTLSAGGGGTEALPAAPTTPAQPIPVVRSRAEIAAAAKPKAPTIITPEPTEGAPAQPTIESEGRPATWDDNSVLDLAAKGNRAAISQVGVRQLAKKFAGDPRLENIRYVMGDIDYRNLITSPREVTRFTPEGQPIRQEVPEPIGPPMDRIARASRERAPAPPEPGPGTLPLNFEQAAPIPSWKPLLQHPEEAPASFRAGVERPDVLPGMEEHVAAQNEGAARVKGEELTREMNRPTNINEQAGAMETLSPLFRGKGPQGELLQPLSTAPAAEAPVAPMEKPAETEPEPKEAEIKGVTEPVKKPRAKREAPPDVERKYDREEIEKAELLLAEEGDKLANQYPPGVYFSEYGDTPLNQGASLGEGQTSRFCNWTAANSLSPSLDFLKNFPEWGGQRVLKALRNKDSADYKRMIDEAVQFNRRLEEREREAIQKESEEEGPIPNWEPL